MHPFHATQGTISLSMLKALGIQMKETCELLASSRPKLKDGLKGLPDPSPYPIAQLQFFKFLYFGTSLLPTT